VKDLLQFEPIKIFIKTLGKDIEKYFGADKGALVYLKPDGVWYARGLYQWLKKKKRDITITSMEDGGDGLEEEKVRGRKVLIVINESFSGKAYKRSMEAMRAYRGQLKIKGIKFAAYRDRPGTADFAVDRYSTEAIWRTEEIDALDLKIMQMLAEDGRMSMSAIAQQTNLSAVAVKNRIDRLLKEKVFRIVGVLNIDQFYTMSAHIQIEADQQAIERLVERFQQHQAVYHLARKISGRYNLLVGSLVNNLDSIEEFVEQEVRKVPGIKQVDVYLGEPPLLPTTFSP